MAQLELTRLLGAPPERVWQVLTHPAAVAGWFWAQLGASVVVDLRVGGEFRIKATPGPGDGSGVSGRYLAVEPPGRLVFTWHLRGGQEETLVTITLTEVRDGETTLSLVHDGFVDDQTRDDQAARWRDCLDRLPTVLELW